MGATLPNGQFFGELRSQRIRGGVTLSETRYPPGFRVPRHAHQHPYLCLVLEGAVIERPEGDVPKVLRRSSLYFHPGGQPHAEEFNGEATRLFSVQLGGDWLGRMAAQGLEPPDRHLALQTGKLSWILGHLHEEYRRDDPAAALAVEGLVLATLAELTRLRDARARGRAPGWLPRVIDRLHASGPAPSMAELAELAGVHPVHLTRTFRRHAGCTPGEFLRRLRIDDARRRLARTDATLAAIALDTGFADQSHFTRVFRTLTGQTPAEYRRRAGRQGPSSG